MTVHLDIPFAFEPNRYMNTSILKSKVNCNIESKPRKRTAIFSLKSDTLAEMLLAAV